MKCHLEHQPNIHEDREDDKHFCEIPASIYQTCAVVDMTCNNIIINFISVFSSYQLHISEISKVLQAIVLNLARELLKSFFYLRLFLCAEIIITIIAPLKIPFAAFLIKYNELFVFPKRAIERKADAGNFSWCFHLN